MYSIDKIINMLDCVENDKGLIKKNTCDRQKARLNKKVKEMI